MTQTKETTSPVITVDTNSTVKPADMYQVVLWNDDHTEAGFVVSCIMQVFKHDSQLAMKIMLEAHNNGKAIAEVESAESANLHREQLQSFGLTVTVEKILSHPLCTSPLCPVFPFREGKSHSGRKGNPASITTALASRKRRPRTLDFALEATGTD